MRKKAVHYKVTPVGPYWRIVEDVYLGVITIQWRGGTLITSGITDKRRIEDARRYPASAAWFRSKKAARAEISDQVKRTREREKDLEDEIRRLRKANK